MQLVGIRDLSERWQYFGEEISVLVQSKGFPQPFATVDGRNVWELTAIETYELNKPNLH